MNRRESSLDDLIRAQREAGGMTAAQRAQNRARLLNRALLGTAVSVASVSGAQALAATARAGTLGSWVVKAALGIVLASGAGTAYFATRPATVSSAPAGVAPAGKLSPASQPVTGASTTAEASASLTAPTPSEVSAPEPVPRAALASAKPRAARRAPESASLAVEVQLMHDVDSALRAGRPEQALALLDARRVGNGGVMGEERTFARILTLCQLGNVEAARAEAKRFLRDRPRSPLAARVRATCGKPVEGSVSTKAP